MQKRATRTAPPAALALFVIFAACATAAAQDEGGPQRPRPRNDINHEVHLHLLVTAPGPEASSTAVPRLLDGVVRQLKAAMPPSEYRLAATFINRVRDGGVLEVKSAGGAPFSQGTSNSLTPTFFQFSLGDVKLEEDASGQGFVNIRSLRLGLKVPIQTATVASEKGASGYPVIQYEDTGITTQLSVREGEPTLVGTLGTRVPDQLFILVITVRRAGR